MGKIGKFVTNLYGDGFRVLSVAAPLASLAFTACKFFGIATTSLQRISYAWAFLPIILWLLIAYIRRWYLYEQTTKDDWQATWPIADALNYIVNDSQAKLKQPPLPHIAEHGPAKGKMVRYGGVPHNDARARVQEKLIAGSLRIWGLRERQPSHPMVLLDPMRREIPQSYWNRADLEWLACYHVTETVLQTVVRGGISDYRYSGLMVCKEQVVCLWPRKSIIRRFQENRRRVHRVDYWQRPLDIEYRLIDPNAPKFESREGES